MKLQFKSVEEWKAWVASMQSARGEPPPAPKPPKKKRPGGPLPILAPRFDRPPGQGRRSQMRAPSSRDRRAIDAIFAMAAALYEVEEAELRGRSLLGRIVVARQYVHYEAFHSLRHLSLPSLSKMLERDHTTILYSVRTEHERRLQDQKPPSPKITSELHLP